MEGLLFILVVTGTLAFLVVYLKWCRSPTPKPRRVLVCRMCGVNAPGNDGLCNRCRQITDVTQQDHTIHVM